MPKDSRHYQRVRGSLTIIWTWLFISSMLFGVGLGVRFCEEEELEEMQSDPTNPVSCNTHIDRQSKTLFCEADFIDENVQCPLDMLYSMSVVPLHSDTLRPHAETLQYLPQRLPNFFAIDDKWFRVMVRKGCKNQIDSKPCNQNSQQKTN